MTSFSLTRFDKDGIELLIDTNTGESFASISGYARMVSKAVSTIHERLSKKVFGEDLVKNVQIQTPGGLQGVRLITEDLIVEWLPKDNPKLATQLLKLGIRKFLHQIAGVKIDDKPKSRLQLVKEQVRLIEEIEQLEQENKSLVVDNQRQSEIIDELFDYSSCIRMAKYNKIAENKLNWCLVKATSIKMGLEIKKAPCARYDYKNLYHHNAWLAVYPMLKIPSKDSVVNIKADRNVQNF